jgi:cell division protein FtsL
MTIFNPSQQKKNVAFVIVLCSVVFIGGIFLVYEYNTLAGYRAEERKLKQEIQEVTAKNGELNNEMSMVTDARVLEDIATASNLISERTPQYLTVAQ